MAVNKFITEQVLNNNLGELGGYENVTEFVENAISGATEDCATKEDIENLLSGATGDDYVFLSTDNVTLQAEANVKMLEGIEEPIFAGIKKFHVTAQDGEDLIESDAIRMKECDKAEFPEYQAYHLSVESQYHTDYFVKDEIKVEEIINLYYYDEDTNQMVAVDNDGTVIDFTVTAIEYKYEKPNVVALADVVDVKMAIGNKANITGFTVDVESSQNTLTRDGSKDMVKSNIQYYAWKIQGAESDDAVLYSMSEEIELGQTTLYGHELIRDIMLPMTCTVTALNQIPSYGVYQYVDESIAKFKSNAINGDDYVSFNCEGNQIQEETNVLALDDIHAENKGVKQFHFYYEAQSESDNSVSTEAYRAKECDKEGFQEYLTFHFARDIDGHYDYYIKDEIVNGGYVTIYEYDEDANEMNLLDGVNLAVSSVVYDITAPDMKGLADAVDVKLAIGEGATVVGFKLAADDVVYEFNRDESGDTVYQDRQYYAWGYEVDGDYVDIYTLTETIDPNVPLQPFIMDDSTHEMAISESVFTVDSVVKKEGYGLASKIEDCQIKTLAEIGSPIIKDCVSFQLEIDETWYTFNRKSADDEGEYHAYNLNDSDVDEEFFVKGMPYEGDEVSLYFKNYDDMEVLTGTDGNPMLFVVTNAQNEYYFAATGHAETSDVKMAIGEDDAVSSFKLLVDEQGQNGYFAMTRLAKYDMIYQGKQLYCWNGRAVAEQSVVAEDYTLYTEKLDFVEMEKLNIYYQSENGQYYVDDNFWAHDLVTTPAYGVYGFIKKNAVSVNGDNFIKASKKDNVVTLNTNARYIDAEGTSELDCVFISSFTNDGTQTAPMYIDIIRQTQYDVEKYYAWRFRLADDTGLLVYTDIIPSKTDLKQSINLYQKNADTNVIEQLNGTYKVLAFNNAYYSGSYNVESGGSNPIPYSYGYTIGKIHTLYPFFTQFGEKENGYYPWNGYFLSGETVMWYSTELPTEIGQSIDMYKKDGSDYVDTKCNYVLSAITTYDYYDGTCGLAVTSDVKKHLATVNETLDTLGLPSGYNTLQEYVEAVASKDGEVQGMTIDYGGKDIILSRDAELDKTVEEVLYYGWSVENSEILPETSELRSGIYTTTLDIQPNTTMLMYYYANATQKMVKVVYSPSKVETVNTTSIASQLAEVKEEVETIDSKLGNESIVTSVTYMTYEASGEEYMPVTLVLKSNGQRVINDETYYAWLTNNENHTEFFTKQNTFAVGETVAMYDWRPEGESLWIQPNDMVWVVTNMAFSTASGIYDELASNTNNIEVVSGTVGLNKNAEGQYTLPSDLTDLFDESVDKSSLIKLIIEMKNEIDQLRNDLNGTF